MSKNPKAQRKRRHRRVRKKVEGRPERPRLCVFASNKHIYCQVVDDWNAHTLASASSLSPELRDRIPRGGDKKAAAEVGTLVAEKCLKQGIEKVVFDRGGFRYHGRVRALAEAARKRFADDDAPGF